MSEPVGLVSRHCKYQDPVPWPFEPFDGFPAFCEELGLTEANLRRAATSFYARHYVADNGCWIWTGTRSEFGYGHLSIKGRVWKVHRWIYTVKHGPVPSRQDLDHYVCETKPCCNPDHVRPTSRWENLLRADTPAARNLAKTHCPHGHLLPPPGPGRRYCRECDRLRSLARWRASRDPAVPETQANGEQGDGQ